jgi:hypothetical protein
MRIAQLHGRLPTRPSGLNEGFAGRMRNWKGFVAEGGSPRGNLERSDGRRDLACFRWSRVREKKRDVPSEEVSDEFLLQDSSRKEASALHALPPAVLRVVSAWRRRRRRPRVQRSAVRIVDAEVRSRMAIIKVRPPANVRYVRGPVRNDRVRGRAITARAAIRVHGAIASNVTNVRAVVR